MIEQKKSNEPRRTRSITKVLVSWFPLCDFVPLVVKLGKSTHYLRRQISFRQRRWSGSIWSRDLPVASTPV